MGGGGVFASPVVNSSNSEVCGATLRGHVTAVSVVSGYCFAVMLLVI